MKCKKLCNVEWCTVVCLFKWNQCLESSSRNVLEIWEIAARKMLLCPSDGIAFAAVLCTSTIYIIWSLYMLVSLKYFHASLNYFTGIEQVHMKAVGKCFPTLRGTFSAPSKNISIEHLYFSLSDSSSRELLWLPPRRTLCANSRWLHSSSTSYSTRPGN